MCVGGAPFLEFDYEEAPNCLQCLSVLRENAYEDVGAAFVRSSGKEGISYFRQLWIAGRSNKKGRSAESPNDGQSAMVHHSHVSLAAHETRRGDDSAAHLV